MGKLQDKITNPSFVILRLRHLFYTTLYRLFFKKFGSGSKLDKPLFITPNSIEIGKKVHIGKNCRIEGVKWYANVNFNPNIIIEDNVGIEQNLHLTCANSIIIKKNTAIANNVTITDIDHTYTNIDLPIEQQPLTIDKVVIAEDSKIYSGAVILMGAQIGKHTVVAANAVVKKGQYPDYVVLAGIPAIIVKRFCFENSEWQKTDSKGNFIK